MEVNILKNNIINSMAIFQQHLQNTIEWHIIDKNIKGGEQLDRTTYIHKYYEYIILTQ